MGSRDGAGKCRARRKWGEQTDKHLYGRQRKQTCGGVTKRTADRKTEKFKRQKWEGLPQKTVRKIMHESTFDMNTKHWAGRTTDKQTHTATLLRSPKNAPINSKGWSLVAEKKKLRRRQAKNQD